MNARDECFLKMKNFQFRDVIGCGACGVVYLVYDPLYRREFALKSIKESKFNKNEVDCMKQVDDSNIVRLYNYDYYDGSVYLLMEYCPTSLDRYIRRKSILSHEQMIKYATGILKAIRACHHCHVAHLDIKPANFLIDYYDRIRVCDFGFSSIHSDSELDRTCEGSVPFMAPEIIQGKPHDSFKADMWAIGVTFFIMATGVFPWAGDDRKTLCENLQSQPPRMELVHDTHFAGIIKQLLSINPDERPSIDQLLESQLFRESSSVIGRINHKKMHPYAVKACCYSLTNYIVVPRIQRTKLQQSI
ncbi:CAMK family protein kinase [Trichomonas vaginalis G3]|uniref:CAMK family protein kinase n=1 Tax=Trichomonas vaginalis (strain ATCC PRA-98 / G3) TaxID=412133 RepID=A2DUM6_TRIV3|nr:protein serine/threonine kinase protein [Trichomonas vaginalis G3]EAY15917.1 CAMK family protein kinase [Trichomonas vaginalis G3]KAI5506622.1 protein serine/threonine kinase protein [Trichomonas vaginalis G3]|eukprot:XP_001328140.1 CAMK family protein kinase [Trichomonas vaginalis G3]